jgi:hypothetical protein
MFDKIAACYIVVNRIKLLSSVSVAIVGSKIGRTVALRALAVRLPRLISFIALIIRVDS